MEQYRYYSTQRPIGPGTCPTPPDNRITAIENYDERRPVEGGVFHAWGMLTYEKPLTAQEQYSYELRPARSNPDVLRTMAEQAQVVGAWELYRHIPEEKRVTEYDPDEKRFCPRRGVSPERLNAQHNSAQKFPVPKRHPDRPRKPPCREGR